MARKDRTLMEGLDIVTLHPDSGLVVRVHGFFGNPTPIAASDSGIPRTLRSSTPP